MTDLPFPTSGIPFYKGKLVSVPGSTGLIGSWVIKILRESDAKVLGFLHKRPGNQFSALADRTIPVDFTSPEGARYACRGAEIVVNCAGITGGIGITKVDPVSYVGPATMLACNLIDACHREGVERMGFLSSTTVYPAIDWPADEDGKAMSNDPESQWTAQEWPHCSNPYKLYEGIGHSKRFLEQLCRYYYERVGLKCAVVRPSGAYGRFDNFDESTSHVVPGMIQRALKGLGEWRASPSGMTSAIEGSVEPGNAGGSFEVWGDGEDVRDLIHAQDVAYGYLLAVAKVEDATPINLASGTGVTTRTLAEHVLRSAGSEAQIVCNPDKPTALRSRLVNIDRAVGRLGFAPRISLADGIADTVQWYRGEIESGAAALRASTIK